MLSASLNNGFQSLPLRVTVSDAGQHDDLSREVGHREVGGVGDVHGVVSRSVVELDVNRRLVVRVVLLDDADRIPLLK